MKTTYEAPTIADLGTFEEITQGAQGAGPTDRVFPAGTPRGELTFS